MGLATEKVSRVQLEVGCEAGRGVVSTPWGRWENPEAENPNLELERGKPRRSLSGESQEKQKGN